MAEYIIQDSTLTGIADAIREKLGTNNTFTPSEMDDAILQISAGIEQSDYEWEQLPTAVKNYLNNVTYDPSDYTTSQIANYAPAAAADAQAASIQIGKTFSVTAGILSRNGYEQAVNAGNVTVYNDIPNQKTPYTVIANGAISQIGTLKPTGRLRKIHCSTVNVRDLGGWTCDGGTVKYKMLYRGGNPNAADVDMFLNQLGIRYELDLRGTSEAASDPSALENKVRYSVFSAYAWYSISNTSLWTQMLRAVFNAVNNGVPLYFHCAAGADRTGTLACVLEALLGMSQSDIDKDYELTSFYTGTADDTAARRRNESEWRGLITEINAKTGNTFRDKVVRFVLELGFSISEINAFRAAMIDGTPEVLTVNYHTVTNTLTNVTNKNSAAQVEDLQPYQARILPTPGYLIDAESVSVKMGGVDITSQVFSGTQAQPSVSYQITNNLSNCASSNNASTIAGGHAYTATLSALTGYTMTGATVTITMGGVDVSTYYSDGTISIPQVTGNIVITATAAALGAPNLIPTAINSDGTAFNGGTGYKSGYRLNSSGAEVAQSGAFVTGFIPVAQNDVVHFEDIPLVTTFGASGASYCYIAFYNSNFEKIYASQTVSAAADTSHITCTTDNGVLKTFTVAYNGSSYNFANVAYMRVSNVDMGADSYIYIT